VIAYNICSWWEHLHNSSSSPSTTVTTSPGDIEVREYSWQSPDWEATKDQGNAIHGGRQLPLSIGGGNGNSVPYGEKDDVLSYHWGRGKRDQQDDGEIFKKKYKGMEKMKFGVDAKTEKMTIRYPYRRKEETT
jgi:hypothetical protein